MSQNEFASQLTKLGLPSNIDASALVQQALQRNKRRIRALCVMTIGLWAATLFLVPAAFLPFAAMMKQKAVFINDAIAGKTAPLTVEALGKLVSDLCLHLGAGSIFILSLITLASLLAAISTVWLVLTVRRVTLEQVSLGLAQISQQLQKLESARG